MQIMKAFFLNAKKQLRTSIMYICIFAVLLVIFANTGKQSQTNVFSTDKITMVIQDQDQSALSKGLVRFLTKAQHVKKAPATNKEINDDLYFERIDYVLTIPSGFEQDITSGKTDKVVTNRKRPSNTNGFYVDSQINQYLNILSTYLTTGYTPKDASHYADTQLQTKAEVSLKKSSHTSNKDPLYYTFCFIPYILMCMLTIVLGGILINFRESNLSTRIQCSSLSVTRRNLELTGASILFSILCWGVFLIMDIVLYNKTMFTAASGLKVINSFAYLLVAISITFLISFLIHSSSMLNMVANGVSLSLSFLGGIFVPLEIMDKNVVTFAHLLPSYWYSRALTLSDEYTGAAGQLQDFYSYVGIEVMFALALLAAALVVSRQKGRE